MINERFTIAPKGEESAELRVQISKDDRRALQNIAHGLGTSVAGYVRVLIRHHLDRAYERGEQAGKS